MRPPSLGRYSVQRRRDGRLTVLYRERPGAPSFECSTSPAETPIELLRAFVASKAAPGDVVELGESLFVRLKEGAA